ncbi:galanin receptor type 1-like [Actinia tenebrosa]|uniref:Galanin receptor type 1-like n=1 Tax=Actinia tenebrosa TaxID=6105 RepID=A0A6P8I3C0_ACTTE|nr:galanin receptor type 1-like [Actinia tenebrosa]
MELLANCSLANFTFIAVNEANCTNSSNFPFIAQEFKEPEVVRWLRIVAYGMLFLSGVVGNLMVVLAFRQPRMKTVPNLFITNLAIADGVVSLVNVPLVALHAHLSYWPFGNFLCKLLPFLQGVSLSASIGTMMAIAADRYKVIVHYELPKLTLMRAKFWIGAIWLASCVLPSPLLYYSTTIQAPVNGVMRSKCTEIWPNPTAVRVFSLMIFLFLYFIPLVIICGLYGLIARAFRNLPTAQKVSHKAQKHIIRMFNVVVFFFALCWLPYHVLFLYMDYAMAELTSTMLSLVLFTQWLVYANSACDPILYAVFNTNYRRQFTQMLKFSCKRDYSVSSTHAYALQDSRIVIGRQASCPVPCSIADKEQEPRRPTI